MKRKIDWTMGGLQIGVIITAFAFVACLVRWYHHQSSEVFVPFWEYLASIRIAVPPIIILFVSYLLVFIGGMSLGEAPKVVIRFLKNRFFQNRHWMVAAMAVFVLAGTAIFLFTEKNPPPTYSCFVTTFLGGEGVRHTLIKETLPSIKNQNPALGQQFEMAAKVFEERSRRNFGHTPIETTAPRIFVRSLGANINDTYWKQHPVRLLALAEAYSMWAQAEYKSSLANPDHSTWQRLLEKCLTLNKKVILLEGNTSHPLLKYSAINNSGNAHLYVENYAEAYRYYEEALDLNRNLSAAGNLIAVLILQSRNKDGTFDSAYLEKAIRLSAEIREWALENGKALTETSQFSSVLGNAAFAYMCKGDFAGATNYFREAYAMQPDELNALNLAFASIFNNDDPKNEIAQTVLKETFKYPELDLKNQEVRVLKKYNPCYYLITALMVPENNPSLAAAHYYTYMGRAKTEDQFKEISAEQLVEIKSEVLTFLDKEDKTPCQNLALIPAVRRHLRANKSQAHLNYFAP